MAPLATFVVAAVFLSTVSIAAPAPLPDEPLVTTAFAKKVNHGNLKGLVKRDRARAQALLKIASGTKSPFSQNAVISVPATNRAVTYTVSVGVGNPPTQYDLIVDTGSSNTWIGSGKAYNATTTSRDTGNRVDVTYGSGSFSGEQFIDRVSVGPNLVIPQQSIGVADNAVGFDGVDGIIGLGPVGLTQGTVQRTGTVPTVTDNLFKQRTITQNLIGVSFNPTNTETITNGEITFGGTDSSRFTGTITFASITRTSPASSFWGIDQSINLGGTATPILAKTAGIVDTGTTLVLIASNAFKKYLAATGGVLDDATGLVKLNKTQFDALKPLNFVISGRTFALSANGQLWPRSLNLDIGGEADAFYSIVADLGTKSGQGLDFINGQTFLERFYSVYDTANRRVGFATTPFTNSTGN